LCRDNWCCDSDCRGQCEHCGQPGKEGLCSIVFGPPPLGRPACEGEGECSGRCDGDRRSCKVSPAATPCGVEACNHGVATERGGCDGHGGCIVVYRTCAPYGC